MTRKNLVGEIATWASKVASRQPIVYSTSHPDAVAGAQARYGQTVLADAIESFFADLARELAGRGFSRFVIGGGETSGAVVQGLGLEALSIGPEIDPGVPAMTSIRNGSSIGLALKSGNFGAVNFYAKAIAVLEQGEAKGASP
jgi:3-dehydrotetronate 4-kinase